MLWSLATLYITTNSTAFYFSLSEKNEKPTSNNLISNNKAAVNKEIFILA